MTGQLAAWIQRKCILCASSKFKARNNLMHVVWALDEFKGRTYCKQDYSIPRFVRGCIANLIVWYLQACYSMTNAPFRSPQVVPDSRKPTAMSSRECKTVRRHATIAAYRRLALAEAAQL